MSPGLFVGLLTSIALGGFAVGVGIGRLAERGHHRLAGWLTVAVIVLGPGVVGWLAGGAS